MTTAQPHHIQIGDSTLCEYTGCLAGGAIAAKASRMLGDAITCGQSSAAAARRTAAVLRPYFKPGVVKIVPGHCGHSL